MNQTAAARTRSRSTVRPIAVCSLVVIAVIIGTLLYGSTPSSLPSFRVLPGHHSSAAHPAVTVADGVLPERVTVFDDSYPGVAELDPHLLGALRSAAKDAGDDGIVFYVNSGWRSPAYQDELLREAVSEYGSEEEAARWVATADTSPHVSGDAVDLGPSRATTWLSEHGARYGLCEIYRNEYWHYELRPETRNGGCPASYADPTHDPRMQQ